MAAPTFSGDNIIETIVAGELLLNKCVDDVLVSMRENESGECVLTPAYWFNILNIKLSWDQMPTLVIKLLPRFY